jgi:hypothetical protein
MSRKKDKSKEFAFYPTLPTIAFVAILFAALIYYLSHDLAKAEFIAAIGVITIIYLVMSYLRYYPLYKIIVYEE